MNKQFTDYQKNAHKELCVALELIGVTYELSKDPKILISALHHIKNAQKEVIFFMLYLKNKSMSVELFLREAKNNDMLTQDEQKLINEVYALCMLQKESAVEFRRKENYVLCDEEYDIKTITRVQLQKYVEQTVALIEKYCGEKLND